MRTIRDNSDQPTLVSATPYKGRLTSLVAILCVILVAIGAVIVFIQQREIDAFKFLKPITPTTADSPNPTSASNERSTEKPSLSHDLVKVPAPLVLSTKVRQLSDRVKTERSLESINSAFGPLIKRLNLDPTKAAQFKKLLDDERHVVTDALEVAKAEGIQSPQDYVSILKEAVAQIDLQIQTLLGADDFEQFKEYRQTFPEQQTVGRLADRLANTAAPLTQGQQMQLVQLLNQMEPSSFKQNEDFYGMIGLKGIPLTRSMVSASASVLTPQQVQALDTMQKNLQAREQMVQMLLQRKK